MAVGDTYTSDQGPNVDYINQLRNKVVSGYRGLPQMKQDLAETIISQDPVSGTLAQERGNLIQQLYEHDKMLNEKYRQETSPYFIADPLAREQGLLGHEESLWNALGKVNSNLETRRKVMGSQVEQGVSAYESGLKAQEKELEYAIATAKLGMDPDAQKQKIKYQLRQDIEQGASDANLLRSIMKKYGQDMSPDEILQAYNLYSPHGPAKESARDLAMSFGTKYTEDMSRAEEEAIKIAQGQFALKQLWDTAGFDQNQGSFKGAMGPVLGPIAKLQAKQNFNTFAQNFESARALAKTQIMAALSKSMYGLTNKQLQQEAEKYLPDLSDNAPNMAFKFQQLSELLGSRGQMYSGQSGGSYAGAKSKTISPTVEMQSPEQNAGLATGISRIFTTGR